MADRIGQQMGNYQLLRLLGEGGFAEVYLGEHVHLGTQAAIKVLHTQITSDDIDKFRTEARTVARLIHPNIVRVLEFGVESKTPFLVMDYAVNGTLRQRHPRGTQLPLATVVNYVKQVAEALQYAHEEKFIHRDIKPENMLLGRRNEILLSDFGIASVAQSSRYQNTQEVAGTVAYMSPEQIQGKPRPASDQYSLAVVVYEWLTRDRPFHGSFTEIATQHVLAPPTSLREKDPTISPYVEQVVMTALAKDPKGRFGTVMAFARAFEQACQEQTVYVPTPTHPKEELPPTQYAVFTPQSKEPLPPTQLATPSSTTSQSPISAPPSAELTTPDVVDITQGKLLYTFRGHSACVNTVAWSPDGTRIASAGKDRDVQVWEAATGRKLFFFPLHKAEVSTVAWSPDGTRIASAGKDRIVQVWEVKHNGNVLTYKNHLGWIRSVAWSPDGARIVSGGLGGQVDIWDATTGRKLLFFPLHKAGVNAVAWSPDGTHIASGDDDRTVHVWEAIPNGNVITYRKHMNRVNTVAWSPNGTHIASGSRDQTVRIWEATTSHILLLFDRHTEEVNTVAWSPDGTHIASAGKDRTVRVWEAVLNGEVISYQGFSDTVTSVTWSPDGAQIAVACADGTVQVWQCNQ